MINKIIVVLTVLLLTSVNTRGLSSYPITDFTLDTFNNVPDEVDGCACYFYLSQQDESNEKYIFINDYANLGFVSINGKLEEFELISHNKKGRTYTYSNRDYKLKIIITKESAMDVEATRMKGKIVLSKGNSYISKEITGFCGC